MLGLIAAAIAALVPQDPPPGGAQTPPRDPDTAVAISTEDPVRATLQGCAMEEGRWVCRYQMPEIRIVEGSPQTLSTAQGAALPVAPAGEVRPDVGALTDQEKALVVRCADAGWLSLCLPADRRRARELREANLAYEASRKDVTDLLAQGRCDAAVTKALEAGHLNLAREARAFCAR